MEFLTNLGKSIPPGLVAQLYFMRWRIEKSFDEIKNKLHEAKAWAASEDAKKNASRLHRPGLQPDPLLE